MSSVTSTRRGAPYTYADLEQMPDDGHRYEIIDGVLIVSPSPSKPHQRAVGNLYLLLRAGCPAELEVFLAPLDVRLADDSVLEPDVLVLRRDTEALPLLAVEVLSPSTRRFDLTVKRARLEAAGVPSYWVVDPEEPQLVVWELRGGSYVQLTDVRGEESYEARSPYSVTIVPQQLVEA